MARSPWPRRLAHGACAGVLLSCLRAPLGLDWTQLAVTPGTTAALFRAAALLALVLSLDAARHALRGGAGAAWLAALCAGYAVHGLVLDWTPGSRAGYALLCLAGTLCLRALAGSRTAPPAEPRPEDLGRTERLGLFLVGLGAGLALETLAHEVRLFGLGTKADDTVVGTVFLALACVAAAAFGPLVTKLGSERTRSALGFALAGASGLAGLWFLAQLTPAGLHGYLRRFDVWVGWGRALDRGLGGVLGLSTLPPLDGASIGTWWTTAILAAAALVVPGFVLGATLGACRHAGRLACTLAGAALGLFLLPPLVRALAEPLTPERLAGSGFAWTLLTAGATTSALGAALAIGPGQPGRPRALGLALAAAVALVPWIRPRLALWSFSPWSPTPVNPELVLPTAEGLVTVERARDGVLCVTLDRKRLTPLRDEEQVDERRLRLSWSLLAEEKRRGTVRTLFVGQLTPARARHLRSLGTLELARTAAWHRAMPSVEERLFRGEEAPPGRVVSPAEARAHLADGDYDWVVAPPIRGPVLSWKAEARSLWGSVDAPRLTNLELGGEIVGTAWIAADSPFARGARLEPVVLAMSRFESLSLGLVRGRASPALGEPVFALEHRAGPGPLAFLSLMPLQRSFRLESAAAASLGPGPAPELVRGLALHFAAQVLSSPFETRAQQIELEEDALRAFLAALPPADSPRAELDPFTRELWQSLAWLCTEKRLPDMALVYLEPVAERFAPWPALDRAVARAYRELLEPESALPFLERALAVESLDIELLVEGALCARELGDPGRALGFAERALALQPGREDLGRLRDELLAARELEGPPAPDR